MKPGNTLYLPSKSSGMVKADSKDIITKCPKCGSEIVSKQLEFAQMEYVGKGDFRLRENTFWDEHHECWVVGKVEEIAK